MELMQVILHSDAIERFEKLYPDIKHSDYLLFSTDESKRNYLDFLGVIQDLKIIHLVFSSLNMLGYFYYPSDDHDRFSSKNHEKYLEYSESGYWIPEELIKEFVYDPRIGIGYCIQCRTEYPIETGCTHQTKNIYGKCHPKNFLPFFDKEGKKVFKGGRHYKVEWDPDEYIPHSPEIMEKNRQLIIAQHARMEERVILYEARNEPEKAKLARKNKLKMIS